jgi:S1-C subfamily serine protease
MEAVLRQIAQFLFGQPGGPIRISVADIKIANVGIREGDIEEAIRLMERSRLLRLSLNGDNVELTGDGKSVFEKACVAEVCLGRAFIVLNYRSAVKHVAIRTRDGDEAGGTAFFCADFQGWLATARHLVADGNQLLRVENEDGTVVSAGPFETRLAGSDLDLALIQCQVPDGVNALRIGWRQDSVRELDEVLVAGYPPIAGHRTALMFTEGQVSAFPRRQSGGRYSIIISKVTEPGHSGGPVLSAEGLVIGVVERQNTIERKDGTVSIFNGATPAHYFSEFPEGR